MEKKKTNRALKVMVMLVLALSVCMFMAGCGNSKGDGPVIGTCTVTITDQIEDTSYDINEGDTVYDILMKTGLAVSSTDTGNGMSVEAIGGVANGDKGKTSGWLYYVNDEMPMDYCDKLEVQDGDVIVWEFSEGM